MCGDDGKNKRRNGGCGGSSELTRPSCRVAIHEFSLGYIEDFSDLQYIYYNGSPGCGFLRHKTRYVLTPRPVLPLYHNINSAGHGNSSLDMVVQSAGGTF